MDNFQVQIMSPGFAWLDTGTHEALTEATEFVKAVEKRTRFKIACLEEVAFRMKYLDKESFEHIVKFSSSESDYFQYLQKLVSK